VWCQEEPINQGAWYSSQHHMRNIINKFNKNLTLSYAGREASAAPACGYMSLHLEEQKKFINEALVYKS
jgi:2-oxoglutarate dehydrogenase E1 component